MSKAGDYISESIEELNKVSKPTLGEARQATLVTVALVIFVALVVALFDLIFTQLMNFVTF